MKDVEQAIIKASPAVAGTLWSSLTLNEWVAIATLIYVALQIGLLLPKYYKHIKKWLGY